MMLALLIYGNCHYANAKMRYGVITDYHCAGYTDEGSNEVKGVVLHHTAEPTIAQSINVLTNKKKNVGCHVLIDTDGTRYIMCEPTTIAYHAGYSRLGNRDRCNEFTIGIEFQGNTLEQPLTDHQIESAIEYLLPLIKQYNIPIGNIVTHEMVRTNYMKAYPKKKCCEKVDITQQEYERFMKALRKRLPKAHKR